MKLIRSILLLVSFFSIYSFTENDTGILYENKLFSLEFPKAPKRDTQTINTDIGPLVMEIATCDIYGNETGNIHFSLIASDYPVNLIRQINSENIGLFFRSCVDGAVNNVKGQLLSEKEIELSGFPGRQVRINFNQGMATILMRMYLVHNTLIILQTMTKPDQEEIDLALEFHKSFKLKE